MRASPHSRWISCMLPVLGALVCLAGMPLAAAAEPDTKAPEEFAIERGVNISHWLSQSGRRGTARREYFTEKDVEFIASIGYDHIRLPVDEEQLWNEQGDKEADAFKLLHNVIEWCLKRELRVIVDLHILRSHHFNAKEKPLWTEKSAQDRFIGLWKDLSQELRKYPTDGVAYELMNEPVADDPEDWNRLVARAIREIRKTEPKRKIVFGSNKWQSVSTFDALRVPEGDRNIILSFHFYIPMLVTHHQASWTGVGKYKGPVSYPGQLVNPKDLEGLPEDVVKTVERNNGEYTRETFRKLIAKPVGIARKLGLPLYCGEWGCITRAPRAVRLRWYEDVRAVLEENGVAWANWDYRGGFAIKTRDGEPDRELIGILTGNPRRSGKRE